MQIQALLKFLFVPLGEMSDLLGWQDKRDATKLSDQQEPCQRAYVFPSSSTAAVWVSPSSEDGAHGHCTPGALPSPPQSPALPSRPLFGAGTSQREQCHLLGLWLKFALSLGNFLENPFRAQGKDVS